MIPLSKSPRYRQFIHDRDRALEELHLKVQVEVSNSVAYFLNRVMESIAAHYENMRQAPLSIQNNFIRQLRQNWDTMAELASHDITGTVAKLRKAAYLLAHTGEAEAIARSTGLAMKTNVQAARLDRIAKEEASSGGALMSRVQYYFAGLLNDVEHALRLSMIQTDAWEDAKARIFRQLPERRAVKTLSRILRKVPIKEANTPIKSDISMLTGFIDEDAWEDLVDLYKADFVPQLRGPKDRLDFPVTTAKTEKIIYTWELEKEITQDFVEQVRAGQVEAAVENGINDFVWIAILDDRTDECCVWRDGLTSSEIEAELKKSHKDDECDAIVPPAHFNCRCTLAPAVEGLPDQPPSNIGEFNEWLEGKDQDLNRTP